MTMSNLTFGTRGKRADYGNSPQADELRALLGRIARLESTDLYKQLCEEADEAVAAGGRKATHGWGEYGACGDPRKARKAAE